MTLLETDLDDVPALKAAYFKTTGFPQDTNFYGDIPGGWLVNQMDQAAELAAGREAGGRTATVAIEAMDFLSRCALAQWSAFTPSARNWS